MDTIKALKNLKEYPDYQLILIEYFKILLHTQKSRNNQKEIKIKLIKLIQVRVYMNEYDSTVIRVVSTIFSSNIMNNYLLDKIK